MLLSLGSLPGRATCAIVALLVLTVVPAQAADDASGGDQVPRRAEGVVRTPDAASYSVRLRTGAQARSWRGTVSISFRNAGLEPMRRIYLRLWSNGVLGCSARSIVISGMRGGAIGTPNLACTEIPVRLDEELAPGTRTDISMRIEIRVPPVNDRFGHHQGISYMGSALPVLEVHDDLGWHHDPFVDLGESFYSIVGRYRVRFDAPRSLSIAASGFRTSSKVRGTRRIQVFEARDVRDVAWAAGRLKKLTSWSRGTRILLWFRPEATPVGLAAGMLKAAERSMDRLSSAFGRYPYPEVDVVLGTHTSFGGMEYPTLVMSAPYRSIVAHELAHQWWFGIVGNDQFSSPWLDEAFAQWSQGLPWDSWQSCSGPSFPSPSTRLSASMAYWRQHPGWYGVVYGQGACMLEELATRFGRAAFLRVLRRYARDHRLGVTRPREFTDAIEAAAVVAGVTFDADAFWHRWRIDT